MKLIINREFDKQFHEDTCTLGTSMLAMKGTHLFIASYRWDAITLEITDEIPEGSLRHLHMVCDDIKVQLPDKVTYITIKLLCELYPSRAGKIRKAFAMRQDLKGVLEECVA